MWQPIESAPKNRRLILTFAIVDTETGNWNTKISCFNEQPDKYGSHWDGWTYGYQPTHWMPLPDPPTDTQGPPAPAGGDGKGTGERK